MTPALSHEQRTALAEIARQADARLLVLFGSMARGDAHSGSDLDLAIDRPNPADLATHLQLIQEVEEAIPGIRVDFVFLNPRTPPVLRYQVFTEGECLYEGEPGLFDHEFLRAWHLYLDTRRLREYEQAYLRRRSEEAADVP